MTASQDLQAGRGFSRRVFLKSAVAAAGGAAVAGAALGRCVHAAGSDVLKLGLVGCGGRGAGAVGNALTADPNTKLVAVGDALHEGFARVRCPDCKHEMFVAFSCKQRCTCPSCHQKRALLTVIHVAEDVCSPVAHRQVVFTIPKRLRVHTRFDRSLLGKLCSCAWTCVKAEVHRVLGREDVLPGMIAPSRPTANCCTYNPAHNAPLVTHANSP